VHQLPKVHGLQKVRRFELERQLAPAPSKAGTHTDGGAVIRKSGSAWLEGTVIVPTYIHKTSLSAAKYSHELEPLTNWNNKAVENSVEGDGDHCNTYPLLFVCLRVEFLLKTESGYLRDAEVT